MGVPRYGIIQYAANELQPQPILTVPFGRRRKEAFQHPPTIEALFGANEHPDKRIKCS
jgi:hypothetical protein